MNDIRTRNDVFKIPYKVIGIIVDNKDTENRGRLKVRIPELISDDVLDSDLPWAEIETDFFGANVKTIGSSSVPKIGTYVYIEFLYHNPSFPLVTGVVRGKKDSSLLHINESLTDTISETRTTNLLGPELAPLNSSTIYPNNNVIETDTAVIEIDDTSSNQRISIQHKNGSYVEIRPDGTIQVKSKGNCIQTIDGNFTQYVSGNIIQTIKGNVTESVTGDVTQTVSGNVLKNITGTLTVNSSGNMKFTAPRIDMN